MDNIKVLVVDDNSRIVNLLKDAITKESDILSDSILVKRVTERKNVGATDTGAKLKERIAELKELLDAYRNGLLVEKLWEMNR